MFFLWFIVFRLLLGCFSWSLGFGLGFRIVFFSAGGGRSSVEAWFTTSIDIEEVLSGVVQGDVHVFVADGFKSFDTVDRGILDRVLSSLGLPGWFRHAYFEYHSLVRLRFKLSAGLGAALDSGWGDSSRLSSKYDVHCCVVFALV